MRRNSEVLPDPLGPRTASASPDETVRSSAENTSRPPRTHRKFRPESRIFALSQPSEIFGYRVRIFGSRNAGVRLSLWRCFWKDSISPELDAAHDRRPQA